MAQWYVELFKNYAKSYDKEPFTQGTVGEVDFIEGEINFDKSISILDVGCGTGRHLAELRKRGYNNLVGLDLSLDQLNAAKGKFNSEVINLICADATKFKLNKEFDLVILMCEGSFALMETDEKNFDILKNISKAVKPGGKFIFTTLNALFPLKHSTKEFYEESGAGGSNSDLKFDVLTLRETSTFEITKDNGQTEKMFCNERYYMPSEITWLLKSLGFTDIEIYAACIGKFSRETKLTDNDFEMLVISKKA
jgi:SAM-dependent methyltransferase